MFCNEQAMQVPKDPTVQQEKLAAKETWEIKEKRVIRERRAMLDLQEEMLWYDHLT